MQLCNPGLCGNSCFVKLRGKTTSLLSPSLFLLRGLTEAHTLALDHRLSNIAVVSVLTIVPSLLSLSSLLT